MGANNSEMDASPSRSQPFLYFLKGIVFFISKWAAK